MDSTIILLMLAGGALILPMLFAGDDDDDEEKNEIDGTFEDDTLVGTEGPDLIRGFRGDDTIVGNGGLDILKGGAGNDTITGGANRDIIDGASGEDMLFGLDGNDTIEGDAGNDYIDGGFGADVIRGGYGDDIILGGPGARLIDGELVNATDNDDRLTGGADDDTIYSWGGGGLVVGGQNPADTPDDVDTLVLVTGTAELGDAQGDTQFFALANKNDDQETLAVITEFDVLEHEMILTVDAADTVDLTTLPAFTVQFEQASLERENGDIENGIRVSVVLDPLPGESSADYDTRVADFETPSAFFRGNIFAQPGVDVDDVNVSVAFTNQSDTEYLDDTNYENVQDVLGPSSPLNYALAVNKVLVAT